MLVEEECETPKAPPPLERTLLSDLLRILVFEPSIQPVEWMNLADEIAPLALSYGQKVQHKEGRRGSS